MLDKKQDMVYPFFIEWNGRIQMIDVRKIVSICFLCSKMKYSSFCTNQHHEKNIEGKGDDQWIEQV